MNSVRFELVKLIDYCLSSASTCKASCHSAFRAVFKDRRQRPRIFVHLNLFICTLDVLLFGIKNSGGIKSTKYIAHTDTENIYRWIFVSVTVLAWLMAAGLVYAFKRRKFVFCQLWCVAETGIILTYLLMTLSTSVILAWPGLCLLVISATVKLYGLWVIYYFSLEVKGSPDSRQDLDIAEDGSDMKFFSQRKKPPAITRRETDQTSIASSPQSPGIGESEEECNDSVLDDNSPTGASFQFFENENGIFAREPQYSEIMIQQGHLHSASNLNLSVGISDSPSPIPSSSKDNIIISDLMCGGSSTLNVESER